jgi:elongation factor G
MALQTKMFPLKVSIQPALSSDSKRLMSSLEVLVRDGALFSWSTGADENEVSLAGTHESQLDQIIGEIVAKGIQLKVGAPEVVYLETATRNVTKDYTHKRFQHGKCEFARVILEIEPTLQRDGTAFENRASEESVPLQFASGVERGVRSVLGNGPLIDAQLVGIRVTLIDGAYHETDSSHIAFEIAARAAVREALRSAACVVLEPVMKATITAPEAYIGEIIKDMHARHGTVTDTKEIADQMQISATVALANMFGYSSLLNRYGAGRSSFDMIFSHYEPANLPQDDPENFPPAIGMRA